MSKKIKLCWDADTSQQTIQEMVDYINANSTTYISDLTTNTGNLDENICTIQASLSDLSESIRNVTMALERLETAINEERAVRDMQDISLENRIILLEEKNKNDNPFMEDWIKF